MSQYYRKSTQSTPSIPTQFTADDATVSIPAGNNENLFSRDTSDNNENGIQTTTDPNNSENHYTELTNRVGGTASTIGAVTADITLMDFSAAPFSGIPGSYTFEFKIASFDSTTPAAGGYTLAAAARTDGTTPTVIGIELGHEFEDVELNASEIDMVAVGNTLVVRVTGVAGLTISWNAIGTYTRAT